MAYNYCFSNLLLFIPFLKFLPFEIAIVLIGRPLMAQKALEIDFRSTPR